MPAKRECAAIEQSNIFTTARYDYTPTEKRILYRVIEQACEYRRQHLDWFKEHEGTYSSHAPVQFRMPITAFMSAKGLEQRGGEHYDDVYAAFKSLAKKDLSYYRKGYWYTGCIVSYSERVKDEGEIIFFIHPKVWDAALDYSRGFTKMQLAIAFQFRSAYTMRFYELCCQWREMGERKMSLRELRDWLGIGEKYKLWQDLKKRILDPAKAELDKYSNLSFSYSTSGAEHRRGREIVAVTFTIYEIRRSETEDEHTAQLIAKHPAAAYEPIIKMWLTNKMGFTSRQLQSNAKNFYAIQQAFGAKLLDEMEETFTYIQRELGKRPSENKGLFLANLKKKLENKQEERTFAVRKG